LAQVAQAMADTGTAMAAAMQAAPGQLFQMLQLQDAVLAYIDVFFITGLLALLIIPTALALSPAKKGG
jgi:DHA2 family multidrug resistance protein